MSVRCGCHPGDGVAVVHSEATDKCQRTTVKSPQSVTVMSHDHIVYHQDDECASFSFSHGKSSAPIC